MYRHAPAALTGHLNHLTAHCKIEATIPDLEAAQPRLSRVADPGINTIEHEAGNTIFRQMTINCTLDRSNWTTDLIQKPPFAATT